MTTSAQINEPARYRLTRSQELIYTGQLLAGKTPLYNMIYAFRIKGAVNEGLFVQAFQDLVNSTDALRLTFDVSGDGSFSQTIRETVGFEIPFLDLTAETDFDFRSWSAERGKHPLDLSERVFDAAFLRFSGSEHGLYLNIHHLATDALSFPVLLDRLATHYESPGANRQAVSEIPRFADYISYEAAKRESQHEASVWWKNALDKAIKPDSFAGKPANVDTADSVRVSVDLSVDLRTKIQDLCERPGFKSLTKQLSTYNILNGALCIFVGILSGRAGATIGSPVHNRITPAHRSTAGLFIEFFPSTLEFQQTESFAAIIERVAKQSLNFLRYAQPGCASAELSRSFNVVLNFISTAFNDFSGFGVESDWIHQGFVDPGHAFRLHVYDEAGTDSLRLMFDFNTAVFDAEQIDRLPSRFVRLLDGLVSSPNAPIGDFVKIADPHYAEKPAKYEYPPGTVLDLFAASVSNSPDSAAVTHSGKNTSYKDLDLLSDSIAKYLMRAGLKMGDRVLLNLPRSLDYIAGMIGVLKAGGSFVPVPTDTPAKRFGAIAKDAEASFAILHSRSNLIPESTAQIEFDTGRFAGHAEPQEMPSISPETQAYVLYTSGSTGTPKGVSVCHGALSNYIEWAAGEYPFRDPVVFPFFTSVGFDLTLTSLLLPLSVGGNIKVFDEGESDLDAIAGDDSITNIKLTPSHLSVLEDLGVTNSKIQNVIVGGENFETSLARNAASAFPDAAIYNEYGPTESTIGCLAHRFDPEYDIGLSVAIGHPISNIGASILKPDLRTAGNGEKGEIYVYGAGLADGYHNDATLTGRRFLAHPETGERMYATGDLGRINSSGQFEYLGRKDHQVKISGVRVELGEIEAAINSVPGVKRCAVIFDEQVRRRPKSENIIHCIECGLPSNYPGVVFDEKERCSYCRAFDAFKKRSESYFGQIDELRVLIDRGLSDPTRKYDCLVLLSGGKDSTYVLAQIADMGYRVLAFTLDNGYISDQAKENIDRVVKQLNVDHVYGSTPAMDAIFADSLERYSNVCNGCFKTIYTLASKTALDNRIPFVVTGLSRGQFFETRLTEELFWNEDFDPAGIDEAILDARKAYHAVDDAVKRSLETECFESGELFEKVTFIDFYRYADVTLEELYGYLDSRLPWVRPTDTGRSTNCLINKVGIAVHRKERGFSNYSFPYSWDVRMGHKTRAEALAEINEEVNGKEVERILEKIGYGIKEGPSVLTAYLETDSGFDLDSIREQLRESLPAYMIPGNFVRINLLPITSNGKIDRAALSRLPVKALEPFHAPRTELERIVAGIWSEVLQIDRIGIHERFLSLGGQSLEAIRIIARLTKVLRIDLQVNIIFSNPTIETLSAAIERMMEEVLAGENSGASKAQ